MSAGGNAAHDLTLACNIEEFKAGVAEFCKAAPTCDRDSLENGMKAVNLMYLAMNETAASDRPIAVSYLKYAQRRYMDRDFELFRSEAA
jgi:hypothetical protein